MKTKRYNFDIFPPGSQVWTVTVDTLEPVMVTLESARIIIQERTQIDYSVKDDSETNKLHLWPLNPFNTFNTKLEAEHYSREKKKLFFPNKVHH